MIDQNILELYKKSNKYGDFLEMTLTVLQDGKSKYTMDIKEKHLATPIAAHGGVIAGMVDGTLGVAAMTIAGENGNVVSTVDLRVSYIKPVKLGDHLTSIGEVISAGKRLIFTEATVTNQDGVIVAKANGTFNAYPASKTFEALKKK